MTLAHPADLDAASETIPDAQERWSTFATATAWAILLVGAGLRVLRYLGNRSLWLDEAWLALNINHRSFAQLTQTLDYEQGAPVGFLWAVKAATLALGGGEYGLRFVPLVAGLFALLLVYLVVRRTLRWEAALFALAFFALAESGLYYASEVKQYSTDAAAAALVLLAGVSVLSNGYTRASVALLLVTGLLVPWFSHPGIFMLAGLGLTLMARALLRRDRTAVLLLIICGATWLGGFGLLYLVSLRHLLANDFLTGFWAKYFLPFPPTSLRDVRVYVTSLYDAFPHALGVTYHEAHEVVALGLLAAALFAVGCYHLGARRQWLLGLLVVPIAATMAASMAHSYPFTRRMLVFLSPVFVIGMGAAIAWLAEVARTPADRKRLLVFALAVLALPLVTAGEKLRPPPPRQEVRDAVRIIEAHAQPGDSLFVNHLARPGYNFYREHYSVAQPMTITSKIEPPFDKLPAQAEEILATRGRCWVLVGSVHPTQSIDMYLHALLAPHGRVIEDHEGPLYRLTLYDFAPAR